MICTRHSRTSSKAGPDSRLSEGKVRYPDPKQIKIEGERIFLPKAGWTRMVMHRPVEGKVKNVTVSEVAGDWFVSIQVEHELALIPVNHASR